MENIINILKKHGLQVGTDERLEFPHITYKLMAKDGETVISHYFVVKYRELLDKGYFTESDLEESFYDFEKKHFAKYFFREDTDLKWNFYLIIIVDERESTNADICQLEQDDNYLRKLVMTEEEMEIYVDHGKSTAGNSTQGINGIDTYAEWQRDLSGAGLDGILFHSFAGKRVVDYIEKEIPIRLPGRPKESWENSGGGNKKFLVNKIEKLHMKDFRSHCMEEEQEIPLTQINLISGSNGVGKSTICSAIEFAMTGEVMAVKEEKETETGTVYAELQNRGNNIVTLSSQMQNKEKRALDELWYGTTTTGRNSNLNRNFHTFNYLGLEASGTYMRELDIYELVKNLLFGTEVTEAELKMHRYEEAFIQYKKSYDKQIKEILQEIVAISLEEENNVLPREELLDKFRKLGYREQAFIEERLEGEDFLSAFRKIVFQYNRYSEVLAAKCGEDETGRAVMEKWQMLSESRKAYQILKENRTKARQELEDYHQKYAYTCELIADNHERIQNIKVFIQLGAGMDNVFLCKQDFASLKNQYESVKAVKSELEKWEMQYAFLVELEGDAAELEKKITDQEIKLQSTRADVDMLSRQMDIQKKHTDNLNLMLQEIQKLAEEYSSVHKEAKNCPVCGKAFASGEDLQRAIMMQKQCEKTEDTLFQELLDRRTEKKEQLEQEETTLHTLKKEKEKLQEKEVAISRLKGFVEIDGTKKGIEIRKEVHVKIEEAQRWLESNINRVTYAEKVMSSKEFGGYSEETDWIQYLQKLLQKLENEGHALDDVLKEQERRDQEIKQKYESLMEEKIAFSEEEWEEYKRKAEAIQALSQGWEVDMNIPVVQWVKEYNVLIQMIYYAEELQGRQEALKVKKDQVKKLQDEKETLERRRGVCQKACDVIGRQKHLEDIMQNFLKENARQIELFFKLLHRPKEFGTLKIEEGKISFTRTSNGEPAGSAQMSTGQRMALAFSVMITLHIRAVNAPNFIMLDEPVANLDDMHILNLIDLLRELALNGTQIIITTADSQMAKFLRRKFSFFRNEYSHFELLRKGNEQTIIEIVHYDPNRKEGQRKVITQPGG